MSDTDLRATLLAAKSAAEIALDAAWHVIATCHGRRPGTSPLIAYRSLNGSHRHSSLGKVEIARPVLHRYGGDSDICLGNVQEMSAIEAAWEFARRVFLTAMSRLQCLYVERQIESLRGLSFENWSEDTDHPTDLQDAAIRDVITTLYSLDESDEVKTVLNVELDREVARISGSRGSR